MSIAWHGVSAPPPPIDDPVTLVSTVDVCDDPVTLVSTVDVCDDPVTLVSTVDVCDGFLVMSTRSTFNLDLNCRPIDDN